MHTLIKSDALSGQLKDCNLKVVYEIYIHSQAYLKYIFSKGK